MTAKQVESSRGESPFRKMDTWRQARQQDIWDQFKMTFKVVKTDRTDQPTDWLVDGSSRRLPKQAGFQVQLFLCQAVIIILTHSYLF